VRILNPTPRPRPCSNARVNQSLTKSSTMPTLEQLLLVLNGTLSTAAVLGAEGPARQGLALARQLIAAACN